MTCQDCEVVLAREERGPEIEAHLADCPDCRALAGELEANAHAMRALGQEALPAAPIRIHPAYPWWKWTSAAAALVITLSAAWWASRPPRPPEIVSIDVKVTGVAPALVPLERAEIPATIQPAIVPVVQTEPLRVKMLTPDPDVVIYWLIEPKGE